MKLCTGSSPQEAWAEVILPWFKTNAIDAWRHRRPAVVVVPFRSHAVYFRERLLASGISLVGVDFLTPPQIREFMLRDTELRVPVREHLRLLLAIAAEQALDADAEAEQLAAKSAMRTPDHLLRAIDRFEIAGWNFEVGFLAFRPIISRFRH